MKKTILWMFAAVLGGCLTLTSCGDDDEEDNKEQAVNVTPEQLNGIWAIEDITSDDPNISYKEVDDLLYLVSGTSIALYTNGLYAGQTGEVGYWSVSNGSLNIKYNNGSSQHLGTVVKYSKDEIVLSAILDEGTVHITYKRSSLPAINADDLVHLWVTYDVVDDPKNSGCFPDEGGTVSFFDDGTFWDFDGELAKWELDGRVLTITYDDDPSSSEEFEVLFVNYPYMIWHTETWDLDSNTEVSALISMKLPEAPLTPDGPEPESPDGPGSN